MHGEDAMIIVIVALGLYLRHIGLIQIRFGPELRVDAPTRSIETRVTETVAWFVCPRDHRVWEYLADSHVSAGDTL